MRVLVVLLALAVVPLGVSASQSRRPEDSPGARPFQDPKNCGIHLRHVDRANANSSAPATVPAHGGTHGVMDVPCGTVPPPPPPPPPPAPGTASILGGVFDGISWAPLAGWTVRVSGTTTSSTVTDGSGNYSFVGLLAGPYVVCVDVPTGYGQNWPEFSAPCASGLGYTFTLDENQVAEMISFGVFRL